MYEITIDNAEVLKKLQSFIEDGLGEAVAVGMRAACEMIVSDAKERCPVDDGQLRRSITSDVEITDTSVTGQVGTNVEYAPYAHNGTGIHAKHGDGRQTPWTYCDAKGNFHTTKGQKPCPFLEEAVENNKGNILKCFQEVV